MSPRSLVFFALACACAGACRSQVAKQNAETPTSGSHPVEIPSNPWTVTPSGRIKGAWLRTRRGRPIESYRGIRYAEPPVGERRFQPPELIQEYSSDVDASNEGPACPQPVYDPSYYVDEDCLRLNVYTPRDRNSSKLPVVFYMHSGGFYSISGRSDVAGPDYLLDQDLVLVTINYRLASLGFLSTGDELAPGNNGFKDQVAALKWVQRNIASFGGDPGLVTIAGCSAGSFSVMLHMLSPMSKGLFHRAVSISGSPISQIPEIHHQRHLAVKQAELLDCPTHSSRAIIDCLKTKPWRDIGNTLDKFFVFGYDPVLLWAPIVELDFGQPRFLPASPLRALLGGSMHAVPYILGQTTGEFFWKAFDVLRNQTNTDKMNHEWDTLAPVSFILPPEHSAEAARRLKQEFLGGRPLVNDSRTADGLGKLYGDSLIGFGVHRLANLMCRHSPHKVFYYEFAYVGNHSHYEDPDTKKPIKAAHHDDLLYLFGVTASFPLIPVSDSRDSLMVDKMTTIMYNFAKHGRPEAAGARWPPMTPGRRDYLRVGDDFSTHQGMFEDRFRVWDDIYPIQY